MERKSYAFILAAFALGASVGYVFVPTKTLVKIETQEASKTNVDKTTTTTTRPDGTTTTVTVDKTVVATEATSSTEKRTEKINKDWLVSAGALTDLRSDRNLFYVASVQRRVLGELYIGVLGTSQGAIGVGLSFRF